LPSIRVLPLKIYKNHLIYIILDKVSTYISISIDSLLSSFNIKNQYYDTLLRKHITNYMLLDTILHVAKSKNMKTDVILSKLNSTKEEIDTILEGIDISTSQFDTSLISIGEIESDILIDVILEGIATKSIYLDIILSNLIKQVLTSFDTLLETASKQHINLDTLLNKVGIEKSHYIDGPIYTRFEDILRSTPPGGTLTHLASNDPNGAKNINLNSASSFIDPKDTDGYTEDF